jgi:hypothetical protein
LRPEWRRRQGGADRVLAALHKLISILYAGAWLQTCRLPLRCLERLKQPREIEQLWIDYVTGLAREAEAHPDREATIVAIGIHPFVVGTPEGAEALRRVLENFKNQKLVWVTDVQAVLDVAGQKQ